jgi:hypothetical protein
VALSPAEGDPRAALLVAQGSGTRPRASKPPAKTDYVEFAGRPHLSMVGDGWEEVAAGIDSWLSGVLEASKAAEAPAGPPGD